VSRYSLDTSAYSHFRRGDGAVVELVSSARWIGVPAIVLGELRLGFTLGRDRERNEQRLRDFLAESVVEIQVVDDDASVEFARVIATLRKAGRPIPSNDGWIAALAIRDGATLVTYDEGFRAIERVSSRILPAPR
jgi:tRNA(fMet)-specific endonuclease VapC